MKYMTGKAKMMVTGIALGTVAAGGMAALIAAGKVGADALSAPPPPAPR